MEAGAAADEPPKKRRGGGKGKTIKVEKVRDVATWTDYYARKYQNVVLGEDGSFLVLDPALTKTDFAEALASPVKTIPHLMGYDYIPILANRKESSELRAAAEARRTEIREDQDARVRAAKVAYSEAEDELLRATMLWKSAPNAPSRVTLAQAVGAANMAVAAAENRLRMAEAPHRYILKYRDLPRSMLTPGSGDDRPIKNILYRCVPESTTPLERIITLGGSSPATARSASTEGDMA